MNFLEKELVDFYIEDHCGYVQTKNTNLEIETSNNREFRLPSGNRIDLLISANRFDWIIEFKVHAEVSAVVQVLRYRDELVNLRRSENRFISIVQISIAAQFFSEDALYLATRLNVGLIHIAPISKNRVHIQSLPELYNERKSWKMVGKYGSH